MIAVDGFTSGCTEMTCSLQTQPTRPKNALTDDSHPDLACLLTVARNLVGNAYRSRDRRQALQEKQRTTAVQRFGDESENVAVQDAMMRLREQDRDILQLAYWDGLGTADIAAVLQCSESAAKVRLHRARTAFRKQTPAGAESTTRRWGSEETWIRSRTRYQQLTRWLSIQWRSRIGEEALHRILSGTTLYSDSLPSAGVTSLDNRRRRKAQIAGVVARCCCCNGRPPRCR